MENIKLLEKEIKITKQKLNKSRKEYKFLERKSTALTNLLLCILFERCNKTK